MLLYEATSLIKNTINGDAVSHWADLGCGSGTFTKALYDLLPEGSRITAIDREPQVFRSPKIVFKQADFVTDELGLSELNGILMANALHFVQDKVALIRKLEGSFAGNARFVFVEYDTESANLWVPYPLSFAGMRSLFGGLGYEVLKTGDKASAFGGRLYSALVSR
jgi:SAM-dependent methyltransferase